MARAWWFVRTRMGVIYLPTDQGDALATVWEAQRIGDGRPICWRGEDVDGDDVLISLDDIVSMEHSTPEGRARQDDPEGVTEEARQRAIENSKKKWSASEDYE
jgi:hypothetical protein